MDAQKCKRCGETAKIVDYQVNGRTMNTIATFQCPNGHEFKKKI